MPAERPAPAAAALAGAYAEDIGAALPPEDDRALAERQERREAADIAAREAAGAGGW